MGIISIRVEVFINIVLCFFILLFLFRSSVLCFFSFKQGEFIFMRNLVIIRMNFTKGQKAVPITAIFNKGGLKRGFYAGDAGEINITSYLSFVAAFKIKFFNAVSVDDDDACFLRVGGVDKHFLCHLILQRASLECPDIAQRARSFG